MAKRRVTLFELHADGAHRNTKVAYCLPTGDFLFATSEAASLFASSSTDKLFGRNLFHFLCPQDVDRLTQYVQWFAVRECEELICQPPLLLRIATSSAVLWLNCVSVPLTLRLLRCIDRATMINPMQLFANESTFVINEQEYSEVIANEAFSPSASSDDHAERAEALEKALACARLNPPLNQNSKYPGVAGLPRVDGLLGENGMQQFQDSARITTKCQSHDDEPVVIEQHALADYAFEADWVHEIRAFELTQHTYS